MGGEDRYRLKKHWKPLKWGGQPWNRLGSRGEGVIKTYAGDADLNKLGPDWLEKYARWSMSKPDGRPSAMADFLPTTDVAMRRSKVAEDDYSMPEYFCCGGGFRTAC